MVEMNVYEKQLTLVSWSSSSAVLSDSIWIAAIEFRDEEELELERAVWMLACSTDCGWSEAGSVDAREATNRSSLWYPDSEHRDVADKQPWSDKTSSVTELAAAVLNDPEKNIQKFNCYVAVSF